MTYLDNAATSYPKPPSVSRALKTAAEVYGGNPARSGHALSLKTAVRIYEAREAAADFFGAAAPENVIFTQNCTHALNLCVLGVLKPGDHVIISDVEHNSVLRPVHRLKELGQISYDVAKTVPGSADGTVKAFEALIKPNTRLIVCSHGSNVTGMVNPIAELAKLCWKKGVLFAVDAAQTAGVEAIDLSVTPIDFLCMPGHKALYGPAGTGMLILRKPEAVRPVITGGTGSKSIDYNQPDFLPDMLESGTLNTPGIVALKEGIRFVEGRGREAIRRHERMLQRRAFEMLSSIKEVELAEDCMDSASIISFNVDGLHSEEAADRLNEADIACRAGLHCAVLAHTKLGTLERGLCRVSFGAFNTKADVETLYKTVKNLKNNR